MTYVIEKGIPVPTSQQRGLTGIAAVLEKCEVGDSFFVPGKNATQVSGNLCPFRKQNKRFACRTREENGVLGVRVWRIV
jgi:hypothetical protein